MLPRLDELEADLEDRQKRASAEGWLGEIEGIERTLQCLRDKRTEAQRLTRIIHQVNLGMPTIARLPMTKSAELPTEDARAWRGRTEVGRTVDA